MSLRPVAAKLADMIGRPVAFVIALEKRWPRRPLP